MATHVSGNQPTPVQGSVNAGNAFTLTLAFGSNVTAGNAIIVYIACGGSTIAAVTDTRLNTYTKLGAGFAGANQYDMYGAFNTSAGACTVSVTTAGNADLTFGQSEFSGMPTSATGVTDGDDGAAGTSTTPTVTFSPTRSNANDTIIALFTQDSGATALTAGSGFTQLSENESTSFIPIHAEYKSETTTTNNTATGTLEFSRGWEIYAVAIKDAAGGGGETITVDKWLFQERIVRGPRYRALPSGLTPPMKVN